MPNKEEPMLSRKSTLPRNRPPKRRSDIPYIISIINEIMHSILQELLQ